MYGKSTTFTYQLTIKQSTIHVCIFFVPWIRHGLFCLCLTFLSGGPRFQATENTMKVLVDLMLGFRVDLDPPRGSVSKRVRWQLTTRVSKRSLILTQPVAKL